MTCDHRWSPWARMRTDDDGVDTFGRYCYLCPATATTRCEQLALFPSEEVMC